MSWTHVAGKMRTPWGFVPVLGLIVLILGGLWFTNNFERKEIEITRDMSPAARRNLLLAAQKYLQVTGQPAESLEGMDLFIDLPSPDDAIVIRHLPGGLSKSINDNLFNWVEAGGHLLVVPNRLDRRKAENGTILEQLGVRYKEKPKDSNCGCPSKEKDEKDTVDGPDAADNDFEKNAPDEVPDTTIDKTEDSGNETEEEEYTYRPYNSIIDVMIDDFPVQLEIFRSTLLEDTDLPASYRINGTYHIEYQNAEDQNREDNHEERAEEGDWLLQYELGKGRITVMSEMRLFYNSEIGNYDHAFFLSWLLKDADQVWLLYSSNVDSLFTLIWQDASRILISFFVILLLVLWKLQKKGGQLLRPEFVDRHNILAHFEAAGMYNWRTNTLSSMIESNRKNILQNLSNRFFGVSGARVETEIAADVLETKTGISVIEFHTAFQKQIKSEQDLIQTTRALRKVHKHIQGGETKNNDNK